MKKAMLCGVDCIPGGVNCNNYCNHDTSKPMADSPPRATPPQQLAYAKRLAHEALRKAELAWFEYFGLCDVDPERDRAGDIYGRIVASSRV